MAYAINKPGGLLIFLTILFNTFYLFEHDALLNINKVSCAESINGPYRVTGITRNNCYELTDMNGKPLGKLNITQLKPYYEPNLELEGVAPFNRKIHPDELWLYKNPRIDSYVPTTVLWPLVFGTPAVIITTVFLIQKDKVDSFQAVLSCSLGLSLNGVFTNFIKLIVVAFAGMGFVAFYIAGKLHVFNAIGRGKSWRLCVFLSPLTIALGVALSRTCDYHHHWQDVLCGSILGISMSYLCYRQYYPSLASLQSHRPLVMITPHLELDDIRSTHSEKDEEVKWI